MRSRSTFRLLVAFGIAVLLAAAFGISCTSETHNAPAPGSPVPATDRAASSPQLPTKPTVKTSPGEPARSKSVAATGATVKVEKLDRYRIPAEYLVIPSKHFSDAVATVALPRNYEKEREKTYPLVVAFSGYAECLKQPWQGSLAWIGDYKADEAVKALEAGRLNKADFRDLASPRELSLFNRMLQEQPYQGIILVCPYSPPLTIPHGLEVKGYEEFIVKELVPELKRRYRVTPGRVGVDGVSMGGARAMYYGFKYPEIFSTIGSVQGAFGPYIGVYGSLVKKNREMLQDRAIQLVTSDRDTMAPSVERMHRMLEEHQIPHQYLRLTGPHDYVFNQGPGSIALLVFHNEGRRMRLPEPAR